jgi:hypothetical protein
MYLQKVISRKNSLKKLVFCWHLEVNDENSRIRIQDPDPLVRGMDPRIQIRIHTKMSWIRNTTTYGIIINDENKNLFWQISRQILRSRAILSFSTYGIKINDENKIYSGRYRSIL